MYEHVECAGNGARCARLRHSAEPPGHLEPLWVTIGDLPVAPLQSLNKHPGNTIEDAGIEVISDAIVGIYGDKKDFAARPPAVSGYHEEKVDTVASFPISPTRPQIRLEEPDVKGG